MCGIAGIYSPVPDEISTPSLRAMCHEIIHRGPDAEGYYRDDNIGLGMRRLKIIDLKGGHQPIHNEDCTIWTVFNGEIYNYKELRKELQQRGHSFYTESDTETIVHLYEEYGLDFVHKLNGMFGIALWDKCRKKLVLVRDRMGIKPLSYCLHEGRVVFGSEIKSILVQKSVPEEISHTSLDYYLTYGYVPAPHSIFRHVKKLLPGQMLVFEDGKAELKKYWDFSVHTESGRSEKYYQEKLLDLMSQAVERRLVSDVPLGAFLSGGIDSSTVVGLMSRLRKQPVKTFSIGFDEDKYNELSDARKIAKFFKTDHTEFVVKPDALALLPKLVRAFDEPFADSSAIPTYYVSKLAREHVTVALSGDGADELFGGYPRYIDDRKDAFCSRIPLTLRKNIFAPAGLKMPLGPHYKKYLHYISKTDEQRYLQRVGLFPMELKNSIYSKSMFEELKQFDAWGYAYELMQATPADTASGRIFNFDAKTYLPFDILTKVDITSMMNSLEVRVPFLDHELVEFALSIPADLKIKNGQRKYILKKAISNLLPDDVLQKRKQGFALPLDMWFRNQLKDFTHDTLTSQEFRNQGFFSTTRITEILESHQKGPWDYSPLLWGLLFFQEWYNGFKNGNSINESSRGQDVSP